MSDEPNHHALLREVHRNQHLCRVLRTGIMFAIRHCEFRRYVYWEHEDGSLSHEDMALNFGQSVQTPFLHEWEQRESYEDRLRALTLARPISSVETIRIDAKTSLALLTETSCVLARILHALRILLRHAQEYGLYWIWKDAEEDDPSSDPKHLRMTLERALRESHAGHLSGERQELRQKAAKWLEEARFHYKGDRAKKLSTI